ncbi:uncharacterized protein RAG0_14015 [Rhynchosporium agropyri]|uniref:Uncharacterized protein n=1 Tax=Rhynchosporium agropyri TaxID=914238 RepID=A0A1E1LF58_9HELO|nr:uncharacterized protein RAG0_14015 [Rhynchosporium agropyri]
MSRDPGSPIAIILLLLQYSYYEKDSPYKREFLSDNYISEAVALIRLNVIVLEAISTNDRLPSGAPSYLYFLSSSESDSLVVATIIAALALTARRAAIKSALVIEEEEEEEEEDTVAERLIVEAKDKDNKEESSVIPETLIPPPRPITSSLTSCIATRAIVLIEVNVLARSLRRLVDILLLSL